MANQIVRQAVSDLQHVRTPRSIGQQVEVTRGQGLIIAARVHAAAHVTQTGLTYLGALTAEETELSQSTPAGQARYKMVVDHFAGVVCATIAEMSL